MTQQEVVGIVVHGPWQVAPCAQVSVVLTGQDSLYTTVCCLLCGLRNVTLASVWSWLWLGNAQEGLFSNFGQGQALTNTIRIYYGCTGAVCDVNFN